MGRPTKLTQQVQDKICSAIRAGNYRCVAARVANVDERSFYVWIDRGKREGKGLYFQFLQAVLKAEADAEAAAVARIKLASRSGNWQADAWWLERTRHERYGRREHIQQEITGADGGPVAVHNDNVPNLANLTEEELLAYQQLVRKASNLE